jgi:hypothetical protein
VPWVSSLAMTLKGSPSSVPHETTDHSEVIGSVPTMFSVWPSRVSKMKAGLDSLSLHAYLRKITDVQRIKLHDMARMSSGKDRLL